MADPMDYDTLKKVLVAEGLTVREYSGSRDRCRCHSGSHAAGGAKIRPWGPINGVMVHITAGNLGARTVQQYIRDIIDGDPNLPDKVQLVTAPDGVVWINSAGRSNHAGSISATAANHSVAGNWSLAAYQDARGHGVDGNTRYYGIENIAASQMTSAQRDASVRICAAICRHYGWTGQEVCGHGEASDSRSYSDPGLNMGTFRRDVMARVKGSTKPVIVPAKAPAKKATPRKSVISLSAVIKAAKADPKRKQGGTTPGCGDDVRGVEALLVKAGLLNKKWLDESFGSMSVSAYRQWQIRCGYRGKDADGIPGETSLKKLIAKYGPTTYVYAK